MKTNSMYGDQNYLKEDDLAAALEQVRSTKKAHEGENVEVVFDANHREIHVLIKIQMKDENQ